MATITAANNEKIYSVQKWGGLNEHPDGDTRLKLGEASKMVNWKITRDGNLKRRPGQEFLFGLCQDYDIVMDLNIRLICEFASGSEVITVYTGANAETVPGAVTLVGASGVVEHGVYRGIDARIASGTMSANAGVSFTVENGVLKASNAGESITVTELQTRLAALDPDAFLYVRINEVPYAINASCLSFTDPGYRLGGYMLTSEADVETAQPVKGLWAGFAGGKERLLAACDGAIWNLYDPDTKTLQREFIANIDTELGVNFIPFDGDVYIQNGKEYYIYDGATLAAVVGYIPLVCIAIGPEGSGEAGTLTGELVNRLIPKRRVWISPDGTNKVFDLPEKDLKTIDYVLDLATGTEITTGWSGNTTNGTVTFTTAPARAVNSYEIGYTAKSHTDDATIPDYRKQVTDNLFAELYSGSTDSMLVFYGDGTNRAIYTGMDYNGQARADYFPDQYELRVGDSNTPITGMVRDGGALITFKPGGECWAVNYGQITLATGDITTAMYVTPINKDRGHEAPGQVRLVNNSPVTCSGGELYHWINSSYYTSNLTRDERQAKRISDRIQKSIKEIDLPSCVMWDDNDNQEYYVVGANGMALVWNYVTDVWYRYENFDASIMCNFHGDVLLGSHDGKILRLTYDAPGDEGLPIEAEWESGAIDFGAGHLRKYSSMLWVGLKPETGTSVDVCVETDRKNTFRDKVVSSTKAKIPGEPFMVRTKIKAKKFVYYRLLLSVNEKMPAVTVTNVEFRVRQTGYAK